MDQSQITKIIDSQKDYFKSGKTLKYPYRVDLLRKLRSAIKEFTPEILSALHSDLGKTDFEGYATEVGLVLDETRLAIKNLKRWMKPVRIRTNPVNFGSKSYTYHEPFGVSLIISPWNYPFQLSISPLIGALAAGNCAVLKPSRFAEKTAGVIKKMIGKYFDKRVVSVIEGGSGTNKYLISQKWDFIFFTGSSNVGKNVMSECAKNLTPNVLELGGKNPAIVYSDACIEQAAKKICWGKFLNSGQTCIAPDYVLVQEEVKERLVEAIRKYTIEFFGNMPNESAEYPKLINKKHFNWIESLLKKGNILFGGEIDREKNKISPTMIDNVSFDDPVMKEEIFGPVLPVLTFKNIEEAIGIIMQNPNPLALYLFTYDRNIEKTVIERVKFGGGCINDTVMHITNPGLPFGGIGSSGIGKYRGKSSFKAFSNQKSILKANKFIDNILRYPPYRNKLKLVKMLLR